MNRVLFGKLIVPQVVNRFPAFIEPEKLLRCSRYGTIIPILSQLNSIQNAKIYALKAQQNMTHTMSYTALGSQRGPFPSDNPTKISSGFSFLNTFYISSLSTILITIIKA